MYIKLAVSQYIFNISQLIEEQVELNKDTPVIGRIDLSKPEVWVELIKHYIEARLIRYTKWVAGSIDEEEYVARQYGRPIDDYPYDFYEVIISPISIFINNEVTGHLNLKLSYTFWTFNIVNNRTLTMIDNGDYRIIHWHLANPEMPT